MLTNLYLPGQTESDTVTVIVTDSGVELTGDRAAGGRGRTGRDVVPMTDLLDNPVAHAALLCFIGVLVAGAPIHLLRLRRLAGLLPSAAFVAAYLFAYEGVPAFPPLGATAKIFYIAVVATVLGEAVEHLSDAHLSERGRGRLRFLAALLLPLAVVAWIGLPRFAHPDAGLAVAAVGLWLGGAAALRRLDTLALRPVAANGGGLVSAAILTALAAGFAPVALAGGSSTSLLLCLAFAGGMLAAALWELAMPLGAFTAASALGGGTALFAVVATVTLITRHVDVLALVLLIPMLLAGQVGGTLLPATRFRGRLRQVTVGAMAAVPLILVLAVVMIRHADAFNP